MWNEFEKLFNLFLLLREPVGRDFGPPTFAMLPGQPPRIYYFVSSPRWSIFFSRERFLSPFAHSSEGRPSWHFANLIGTLRPIAVGETFRRTTSKVAVELISDRARTILEPIQLGVKTPNGCESITHTTRQWFHRHRSDLSKTAVSVDISNAFNTVNRSAVLQCIGTHFSSLQHGWTASIVMIVTFSRGLSLPATGLFPAQKVCSRGTDPLEPVLFALAILPVIQEAQPLSAWLLCGGRACSELLPRGSGLGPQPCRSCCQPGRN